MRYRRTGVLHLALTDNEATHLRQRYDAQHALAPENQWLDAADVHAVEPDASPRSVAALLSPREHYVDSARLTEAFAAAAQKHGATILTGTPVTRLLRAGPSLRGVRAGTIEYTADHVVLAGGPWTAAIAGRLDAYVPVRPVRGQMLSLAGPKQPLRHVIWGAHAYLVPREDGQTFVGATVEEAGFRRRTTASALQMLRRGAAGLVPALRDSALRRSWAGLRPATPDALPVMGLLPGWRNAWVSTGHFRNGILLAPISGKLVAQSILAGRPDASLAPFSPARFAD